MSALVPLDDTVTVALLYSRVSTDEQGRDGFSLDEQDGANRTYAARPDWMIGGEFRDIQSGTKPTRHDYQRMLATARTLRLERRPVAIVVKFQDRLGRDMPESARAYDELTKLGVDVHVSFSGGVPSELEYYMRALIAQEESRNTSRRVKGIFAGFKSGGWHKPGSAPWGYVCRTRTEAEAAAGAPNSVLDVDPETRPYVEEAWRRFAAGASIRAVAIWAQGLPDAARGGRNLGYQAMRKILRAPVYVGRLGPYDDAEPDAVLDRPAARWPHLVDDAAWRAATRSHRQATRMPKQARGAYALTGLLRCSRCAGRMSGRLKGTQGGTRTARREYICHAGLTLGADNAGRRCLLTVRADLIEGAVLDAVTEMLRVAGAPALRAAILREMKRQARLETDDDTGPELARLDAARRKASDRLHALTTMRADGELDADEYRESASQYRDELERIAARLTELRGRVSRPAPTPIDALLAACPAWARALDGAEPAAIRETLGQLIASVAPVRVGGGRYEIDWDLTPTGLSIVSAAIAGLADERTSEAAATRALLVRVEHSAKAKVPTLTTDGHDIVDAADS
jgi:DNA invertase Pin-like site-specific DNA recombinase